MQPVAHSYICFIQGARLPPVSCARAFTLPLHVAVEEPDGKVTSLLRQHVMSYVDCPTATMEQAQESLDKHHRAMAVLSGE
jgi:hypothetical protein